MEFTLKHYPLMACGHTKERHVVSEQDLIDRVLIGDFDYSVGGYDGMKKSMATTFNSEEQAEFCINDILKDNENTIRSWLKDLDVKQLVLSKKYLRPIGYGVSKGCDFHKRLLMHKVVVLLSTDCYYKFVDVVTAYPTMTNEDYLAVSKAKQEWREQRKQKRY